MAMNGDKVLVRISRERRGPRFEGKPAGRIIRILERAHNEIVGTLQKLRSVWP